MLCSMNHRPGSFLMAFDISPNRGNGQQRPAPTQSFNGVAEMRIAIARKARGDSVAALNQILADTMTLRDLYKNHHWQSSVPTCVELHLLFDNHHVEQEDVGASL